MAMLKCLKVSTIPLAVIVFLFYVIALASHYWTTCDVWKYNNGLWSKCVGDEECTSLYEANVQYRYRDVRCNNKVNAYYQISDGNKCTRYYRCLNGAYDEYTCPANQQFDSGSSACGSAIPTGCNDPRCEGKANKQYYRSDGTVCKSWYKCDNGVYTTGTCSVANEYVKLPSGSCAAGVPSGCQHPTCSGKTDGWYLKDAPTCKNYYTCTGGILNDNQQCNGNQVANPTTKTCSGEAANSNCKDPRCSGKADGNYIIAAVPNHCKSWYTCTNGTYTAGGSCPAQQYYDTVGKQCTAVRPSTCIDYRCTSNSDTYQKTDDTCYSYKTCISGAYTTAACPSSPSQQYYSESSKACSTTIPSNCKNPKCNNLADGWHISDTPTCKNYYICTGGMLQDNKVCGVGKVVNPTTKTCSSTAISTCKDPRCSGKSDGYYTTGSWCKFYFKCTAELYSDFTCGAGEYFKTNACTTTRPTGCYDERCSTAGMSQTTGWKVSDTACASGYRCLNGEYETKSCTSQQFNTGSGLCQTATPTGCKDARCNGLADGYYIKDANTCKIYYKCTGGVYSEGSCSSGNVFVMATDKQSGSCRTYTDSSKTCKDPRCDSAPNSSGWANKVNARCRTYYTCASGFYTESQCATYSYYDTVSKACTTTLPATCNDQRCYGKANGKYRVDINCVNWYECASGKTTATGACSSGTKLDQSSNSCVSTKNPVGCKVDGGYSQWTLWGPCSAVTGTGTKSRTRSCNNPSPVYGGSNCDGLGVAAETTMCWTCPTETWINAARAMMSMATVGAFLALFWSILLNCSKSRHPLCTGGALFLLAFTAGMAGLIIYHSNLSDVPGCALSTGWSMVLAWLGVILSGIAYIISMIAMCQAGETRVSSSDGMQMRGAKAT